MHIGLLEDNLAIRDYLQKALELKGHTVSLYMQGTIFLDALFAGRSDEPFPFDLIMIDLNLPGLLSGLDVVLHVRNRIAPTVLPIVIISSAERQHLDAIHARYPDITCIQKPFKLQTLLHVLEQCFWVRRTGT